MKLLVKNNDAQERINDEILYARQKMREIMDFADAARMVETDPDMMLELMANMLTNIREGQRALAHALEICKTERGIR